MADITLWFTIGTVGMGLGTLLLAIGFRYVPRADWRQYGLLVAVPGIATVAYALMALEIGAVENSTGAVSFAPRYVDWLLTTPIHILFLGLFAGASRRVITRAASLEAATIIFGFAAALVAAPLKWLMFLAGSVAFAGVVYTAYVEFDQAATAKGPTTAALYSKYRAFVIVLWLIYPFIWLVGPPALVLMDVETTALVVTYIDVVAKVGLGLIALNGYLTYTSASTQTASPADD